eukprot:symbB.v1.2.004467.t1/scaffold249.1/size274694/26
MTDAINTVSNRMEELALTHSKSQQQQDDAMQRVQAMNETVSGMRESERAQILQLKRLEEIQSIATKQISHVETEQQRLLNQLTKLSSETKMTKTCIGQLSEAIRGIVEDVSSLDHLCKPKLPSLPWEDDSTNTCDADMNPNTPVAPTPSDQTIILPRAESESIADSHVPHVIADQKRCQPKVEVVKTQWPQVRHTSPVPPIPFRSLQNLSANYSEKPPIIAANFFPRNDGPQDRVVEASMVSPRMPVSQPVSWTMSTPRLTMAPSTSMSPMTSPRFVPSPQRSPRVALSPGPTGPTGSHAPPATHQIKAWQMRPLALRQPEVSRPQSQTSQGMNTTNSAYASPREALQDSSNLNSKLMTPRLEKSLPATERSRRVTSPTRNDAMVKCG